MTLSQQLSWSHVHALLPIKDPLARDFYAEMCRSERWDVRTLRQKKSVRLEGARDVMTHTPDAWVNNDATKINSEVSFTRHSHKPPPLLCWNVPLRLSTERSQGGRAEYGRHFKRKLGALLEGAPA